jgi:exodeoxyribonuclease VII small subunit
MERLEAVIARLADGGASLEELVAAHQEALRLIDEAESELARLRERVAELSEYMKN